MELGVCYYPEQWPETLWASDWTRMRAVGIAWVRVGEFAWSRYEPKPGVYTWDWLARALDGAHAAGLKAVLGTPTATPPQWLIAAHPEILAVGPDGHVRNFGSRRHYCFSSPIYRQHADAIVTAMAQKFGEHPAVAAWQTDNEYGCHDTIISYSAAARAGFRSWCQERYGTIEALNQAWGNVFWSMEYGDFGAIDLPLLAVTELNPAHRLAFWRYSSEQVVHFNRAQVAILRRLSPGRPLIHNYMGFFTQFDHFEVAKDLDIASWDSYPLGFLDQSSADAETKTTYLRTGHPDHTAFHHDLYRGVGRGRWWVMEQQPGPVNWATHNPAPRPGMVRLWTWEAFAQGAEVVSYFRWRQAPFAQEQYHAGLNLPDNTPDQAHIEAAEVAREIEAIRPHLGSAQLKSPVAMIFDYPSDWTLRIAAQGKTYDPLRWCMDVYAAARSFGHNIDIIGSDASLDGYSAVLVPNLVHVSASLLKKLEAFRGQLLIGPRSGSKTVDFQIPAQLPPGPLQSLIPVQVTRVESLPPTLVMPLSIHGQSCSAGTWREQVRSELTPVASFDDGWGALYEHGRVTYLCAWLDPTGLQIVLQKILPPAEPLASLPARGLRLRRLGDLNFAFNYGPETITLGDQRSYLIGQSVLQPTELAIWKK